MTPPARSDDDDDLRALFGAIAAGDDADVARRLGGDGDLLRRRVRTGASRADPDRWFLEPIRHHVYAGDTALHVAAAAHRPAVVAALLAAGADVHACNRRGAGPLHYSADGRPGDDRWDPAAQAEVLTRLLDAGADPNGLDASGVAPIHRAVRTRSSAAVDALLDGGADPRLPNGRGSTPLHLAVQDTGRSDSGSDAARDEQRRIIAVLLARGARADDTDGRGRTVTAAATNDGIRALLGG